MKRLTYHGATRATEDEMRDPNYCYAHGRICMPCPPPPPQPTGK